MPPALLICLSLVGVLFFGTLTGLAYAQMKTPDLDEEGFFRLRRDLADDLGAEGWARVGQSKGARIVSFGLALILFLVSVGTTIWGIIMLF
ncbi:MAG: hypothetical protein AAFQ64_16880 [Pseudomonadota bacterium]